MLEKGAVAQDLALKSKNLILKKTPTRTRMLLELLQGLGPQGLFGALGFGLGVCYEPLLALSSIKCQLGRVR